MPDEQAALLVRNLLEVFNERDETKRFAVIRDIYTEQATFFEFDESFQGLENINKRVTEVLRDIPAGALFQATGSPTRNHNVARLSWTLAPENGPVMASGMDVAVLEGNRIAALYLFIDPSSTEQ
jgi:hypothetical protein